jgi:hypothetical protein
MSDRPPQAWAPEMRTERVKSALSAAPERNRRTMIAEG